MSENPWLSAHVCLETWTLLGVLSRWADPVGRKLRSRELRLGCWVRESPMFIASDFLLRLAKVSRKKPLLSSWWRVRSQLPGSSKPSGQEGLHAQSTLTDLAPHALTCQLFPVKRPSFPEGKAQYEVGWPVSFPFFFFFWQSDRRDVTSFHPDTQTALLIAGFPPHLSL